MKAIVQLRTGTPEDADNIRALLEQNTLPTSDIATSKPEFIVAYDGSTLIAVGGLERFGATGLLRSVAVHTSKRGAGFGRAIVERLEQEARKAALDELVLLTQTAREFFARHGYQVIERARAPAAVQASWEFASLCPQSACCMSKRLGSA